VTIRRACENITAVRRSRWRYWTGSLLALVSVGASSSWAAATPSGNAGPRFTVAPKAVIPATKYYDGINHAFLGTGAMVTLKVGPNKVLRPFFPIRVQECDAHPTSQNDCDQSTTLTYDALTKRRVEAAANGSVTVHFLLWAPLPDRWDPYSVITVGSKFPTTIWVGDDPSNWETSGFVSPSIKILGRSATPVRHKVVDSVTKEGLSGDGAWLIASISVIGAAVLGGGALAVRRLQAKGAHP
jgi:hypothetical protein